MDFPRKSRSFSALMSLSEPETRYKPSSESPRVSIYISMRKSNESHCNFESRKWFCDADIYVFDTNLIDTMDDERWNQWTGSWNIVTEVTLFAILKAWRSLAFWNACHCIVNFTILMKIGSAHTTFQS